jgi:hypothetical protein
VRIVRPVGEDEVVATFLRAELDSERWAEQIRALLRRDGVPVSVVAEPDVTDAAANEYRLRLLDEHRGWVRRVGLFDGFPDQVEWFRAALAPDEVLAIRYINWDWWLELSGGTRLATDAAERIRASDDRADIDWHHPIAMAARTAPELIVVTDPARSRLVLVEGHVRLTAYAVFPEYLRDELEVFLGVAADIQGWSEW